MPKSVNFVGTPFKQIVTGGQRTTESPRSNNGPVHRFAQSATEIRESSVRASTRRASRSGSATASMRSSSTSSYTRRLDRLRRQKGSNTGSGETWSVNGLIEATAYWLFNPESDFPEGYERVTSGDKSEEKGKAKVPEDDV